MDKLFDNDVSTSMNVPGKSWVVLDLGKLYNITKIKYIYPSHLNFVEIGHEYELFFYVNGKWLTLGRKVADESYIEFDNVPKDALLLLRDLTKGKHERCFFYRDGKQVFL